jgi:hypothetical protein
LRRVPANTCLRKPKFEKGTGKYVFKETSLMSVLANTHLRKPKFEDGAGKYVFEETKA